MNKKERSKYVLEEMHKLFPESKSELENWETPFQFLVCIILSAQTTDLQVNKVTKRLFENYPTAEKLGEANVEDVAKIINSINYYKTKAKHIVKTGKIVHEEYKDKVPKSVEKLKTLHGVGTKTANVYLNNLYEANQGIGVDTHVMRVSQRLGFTREKTPDKIALDLQKLYPKRDWYRVTNLFVLYGRYYCKARVKPENSECVFKEFCSWCGSKEN